MDRKLQALTERLSVLDAGWRQHLPAFLNAVSTVSGFGHEQARLRCKVEGVEAVLQQMKSRLHDLDPRMQDIQTNSQVEPRIMSEEKVAAARASKVRLNLGCGHVLRDGFLNVDRRDLPGVDIVADVGALPFRAGQVDEIFSAHVLDRFPQEQLKRKLLPYWQSLLAPDGIFRAVVPDSQAMIVAAASQNFPFEDFRAVLFGAQNDDGDFHFNMFTPDSLTMLLHEAGFTDVEVLEQGRTNDTGFEFEIEARKPA